jgi:hypothetical protein
MRFLSEQMREAYGERALGEDLLETAFTVAYERRTLYRFFVTDNNEIGSVEGIRM